MNNKKTLTVIGSGQIGGSVILALKDNTEWSIENIIDPNREIVSFWNKEFDSNVCKAEIEKCINSDLVLVAVPLNKMREVFFTLRDFDGLIIDCGSVKVPVIKFALEAGLKNYIGGHPMAGNERKGMRGWDKSLFAGRKFYLAGKKDSNLSMTFLCEKFVSDLRSVPTWIQPEEHDRAMGFVSHAQYFLSLASKKISEEYLSFGGPGLESMTRLSNQDYMLFEEVFISNIKNISEGIEETVVFLKKLLEYFNSSDFEGLKKFLTCGKNDEKNDEKVIRYD